MKRFLKHSLPYFSYFYSQLGYRLILLLIVSVTVAFMDGLGLAMFLPLLEMVANPDDPAMVEKMGYLAFTVESIQALGWTLSLNVVLFSMMFFFSLKGVASWLVTYLAVVYQQFFIRKIRLDNIDALAEYRYEAFVKSNAGRIQNTLSGEAEKVVQAYKRYSQLLQNFMMAITYGALAFLSNPGFAILVVIGGGLTNILFRSFYNQTKNISSDLVTSNSRFQGLLIQSVAFYKYLKATGRVNAYAQNLRNKVYEIEHSVRRMGVLHSIITGLQEPLMIGVVILVILIQINIFNGDLGTIVLSILFLYRALRSVMQVQFYYSGFLSYSGSITNMSDFVTELRRDRESNGDRKLERFENKIELKNVSFSYDASRDILSDIDLSFYKNETLALVGESGSGKTTVMNIMSGLLPPSRGEVLIDGIDSRELDVRSFQNRIGYITQEPVIFDDTIFNNVTFWAEKNEENLKRFYSALEQASIDSILLDYRDREDTRLGNNGINLSGGQKQRISIARELYKQVDFLFMDEATSALDSETERVIQENIDKLKGRYTILIIAHRLSTIKNVDRVVLLKQGKIDRIGRYEDLIHESSAFKRMVALQEL